MGHSEIGSEPEIVTVYVPVVQDAGPLVRFDYSPRFVDHETCASECDAVYDARVSHQTLKLPRVVYIDALIPDADVATFLEAIASWNEAEDAPVIIPVPTTFVPPKDSCDVFATAVDFYDNNNVLGWTSWSSCSSYVSILKNASVGTAIHELGHMLNLGHEDDPRSHMHAYLYPDQSFTRGTLCLVEKAMCESGRYDVRESQSDLTTQ